jgi:formylglycine-generating enzyme required for sulfatase activity
MLMLLLAKPCWADTFGSGANSFEIEFVTVGNPGNAADTTGDPNPAGSVPYTYRIGKYEIPEDAVRKANAQSELEGEPLGLTLDARGPNKPATSLSWFEAAMFVNWLNTNTGATPAYKFDALGAFQLWQPGEAGYNPANPFRNTQARYFLPSTDEWYKTAFYDPVANHYWDYPNSSDTAPIPVVTGTDPYTAVWNQGTGPADIMQAGGLSPFGTMGQGGNVLEWQEGPVSGALNVIPDPDVRAFRGEDWGFVINPSALSSSIIHDRLAGFAGNSIGFRVASIPEPSALRYLLVGAIGVVLAWRSIA